MDNAQQQQVSQKVEQDVRMLIGDLHMQLIMLRSMLAVAQGEQQPPAQSEVRVNGDARGMPQG